MTNFKRWIAGGMGICGLVSFLLYALDKQNQNKQLESLSLLEEFAVLPDNMIGYEPESQQIIEMSKLPEYTGKKVVIKGFPSSVEDYGFVLLDGEGKYVNVKLASFPIPENAEDIHFSMADYELVKSLLKDRVVEEATGQKNKDKEPIYVRGVYKGDGVFAGTKLECWDCGTPRIIYSLVPAFSYSQNLR